MNKKLLELAETNPQVKKLLEDVAKMAEYIKTDLECENIPEICALDDYKKFVEDYEHILWICTDPDNEQYGRKIAEGHYQFKEKNHSLEILQDNDEWIEEDIILDLYDDVKIQDYLNPYGYTLKTLKKEDTDWKWIVAECIFEIEHANY